MSGSTISRVAVMYMKKEKKHVSNESDRNRRKAGAADAGHASWHIQKGDEAVAVFNVINQGQAPLIIENITASCGCTVAKWNKDPILPQDTTQIRISYNSNIVGEIKRSVVVKTNDKHKMRTLLTITGNVLYVEEE